MESSNGETVPVEFQDARQAVVMSAEDWDRFRQSAIAWQLAFRLECLLARRLFTYGAIVTIWAIVATVFAALN